ALRCPDFPRRDRSRAAATRPAPRILALLERNEHAVKRGDAVPRRPNVDDERVAPSLELPLGPRAALPLDREKPLELLSDSGVAAKRQPEPVVGLDALQERSRGELVPLLSLCREIVRGERARHRSRRGWCGHFCLLVRREFGHSSWSFFKST